LKNIHQATPVVLAGDYNDVWNTLGKNVMFPAGFKSVSKKANTFPAIMPVRQLDHVYYRGELDFLHSFPGHSNLARLASDHLPLIADFELAV
jgi:endonuclease/exonuclease/phosphatase family metal-dependent hydrolase